ncbi:MAG: site-2 protease family protein [Methanomassiliicoccaceae archaeon]|nr:site-2 protease family protein [Methanomassiliicoccaceae archaeon]
MDLTYTILLILLIIYVPIYIYVRSSRRMNDRGVVTYGPFIMIKTKRGMRLLDSLAKYRRFWAFFGVASKIMSVFLIAFIIFIMIMNLLLIPRAAGTPGIGIEYALAIPGLNPMLPLFYGVIGLVVAVAIHELAHGVQTRANDMTVESMGVLYAVVPIGAFVEPNNDQINNCGRKARTTVFAAGIAVNLVVALILFMLMSAGLMGSLTSNFGDRAAVVNVIAGSPANDEGIEFSTVILGFSDDFEGSVNGVTFDQLMSKPFTAGDKYYVHHQLRDDVRIAHMYMGVFIHSVAAGSPASDADIPIQRNSFLVSIGGHPVESMNGFVEIMTTKVKPGDDVIVVTQPFVNGVLENEVYSEVKLGYRNGNAFLGVTYSLSGFSFTTPDAVLAMAKNPLQDADSLSDTALAALSYIGSPFRGYSPLPQEITWWYESSVMPDDVFWVITQIVFWIFWLNLVLAITNALPAVPFDGGYLFRDGIGKVLEKTHRNSTPEKREKIAGAVTSIVSYSMLFILLLIVVTVLL